MNGQDHERSKEVVPAESVAIRSLTTDAGTVPAEALETEYDTSVEIGVVPPSADTTPATDALPAPDKS